MSQVLDAFDVDLQLFAEEGGEPGSPGANKETEKPENKDSQKTFDEAYVRSLRDEAAKYRVKAKELEDRVSALPNEITAKVLKALGLEPDPDKNFEKQLAEAQEKAAKAEALAKQRLISAEVKLVAAEMGLIDADAALALMDKTNIALDETGNVKGVKEALEVLAAARPWLKKSEAKPQVGSGTNPPGAGGADVNPWKKETFNLTMQGKITKENPALAARLRQEAGVK